MSKLKVPAKLLADEIQPLVPSPLGAKDVIIGEPKKRSIISKIKSGYRVSVMFLYKMIGYETVFYIDYSKPVPDVSLDTNLSRDTQSTMTAKLVSKRIERKHVESFKKFMGTKTPNSLLVDEWEKSLVKQ